MSAHYRNNRCAWSNSEAREQWLFGFHCISAAEDCGASDAGRDARRRPDPHSRIWLCAGLDKSSGPLHLLGVTEVSMRDRVRKGGQLPLHSTEKFVQQHADTVRVRSAEPADIRTKQI